MSQNSIRNHRIDNIRAIGLFLLFLAHSQASGIINEIRSCDVIVLVFISGLMLRPDRLVEIQKYKNYIRKRVVQLILPTYSTITVVLLITFIACCFLNRPQLFSLRNVLNSYLLCEDSIGYIWIIKVYLVNALIAPLLKKINDEFKQNWQFVIILVLEYIIYTGIKALYKYIGINYISWVIIYEWIMVCLPYGIIAQIALRYNVNEIWKKQSIYYAGALFLIVHLFYLANDIGFVPSTGKRPVGLNYLSYGVFVALLMIHIIPNKEHWLLTWISKNSLNLYMVHIVVVMALNFVCSYFGILRQSYAFLIRFIIIVLGTVIIYLCANICFAKIK